MRYARSIREISINIFQILIIFAATGPTYAAGGGGNKFTYEEELRRQLYEVEHNAGILSSKAQQPIFRLSRFLWSEKRYEESLDLLKRCIDIDFLNCEGANPGGDDLVVFLEDVRDAYRGMMKGGAYQQAYDVSSKYIYFISKIGGDDSPNFVVSLMENADILIDLDMFDGAKHNLLEAYNKSLLLKGDNRDLSYNILASLAHVAQKQADFGDAEIWFRRSLELSRAYHGNGQCASYLEHGNLGQFLAASGRPAEAESYLREALNCAPKDDTVIKVNLALALCLLGKYGEAENLYKEAIALRRATLPPDHPDIAHSHSGLASVYLNLERISEAADHYKKALAILDRPGRKPGTDLFHYLNGYATALSKQGRVEEAEEYYLRSLKLRDNLFHTENYYDSAIYENLGTLYASSKKSLPLYEKSLRIIENKFGMNHPNLVGVLTSITAVYLMEGRNTEAASSIRRAISIALASPSTDNSYLVFYYAAIVEWRAGHTESAILLGKMSVNQIQNLRHQSGLIDPELRKNFMSYKQQVYRNLSQMLGEAGRIDEALLVLTMMKEDEYFDYLRRDEGLGDTRTGKLEWTEAEADFAKKITLAAKGPADEFNTALDALRAAMEGGAKDRAAAAAMEARIRNNAASTRQNQEFFQTWGAALLQFVVSQDDLVIFVSTANGKLARTVKISAAEVGAKVLAFRSALTDSHADPIPQARALYDILLAPVAGDLEQAGIKMLVVSLDGMLRYIPFSALHDGKGWVVERYPVVMWAEAAATNLTSPSQSSWRVAGFGVSKGGLGLKPLPAVEGELNSIVKKNDGYGVLPGQSVLNSEFTGAAVKDAVDRKYPVLHMATHFVFKPNNESYLLIGNNSSLTMNEIIREQYYFPGVDLLALSACDTGKIGEDASGREVEGLGVTVLRAGARSALASLWSVADASTALLMRRFYLERERNPALGKAEALRKAQLSLISGLGLDAVETDIVTRGPLPTGYNSGAASAGSSVANLARSFSHPNFWAPFILMGSWL